MTIDDPHDRTSSRTDVHLGFDMTMPRWSQTAKLGNERGLILLDVTMPVMDGPTMLAALRERGDQTPVIM